MNRLEVITAFGFQTYEDIRRHMVRGNHEFLGGTLSVLNSWQN